MFCRVAVLGVLAALALPAQNLHVSGEKIRAHVKYLSSDELQGRGVGTTGGKLATNYIAAQLEAEGVKPGGEDGSYFQRVPLVGTETQPGASLTVTGSSQPASTL